VFRRHLAARGFNFQRSFGLGRGEPGVHCLRKGLKYVARGVHFCVGQAQGGDDAVASAFGGAEGNEEDLVFIVVDDVVQCGFELGFFFGVEVAFKHGELDVVAVVAACFEGAAQAFVVGDVVANKVCGAHGSPREEGDVFRDFAGEGAGQDAGLEFEGAPVADFVVK